MGYILDFLFIKLKIYKNISIRIIKSNYSNRLENKTQVNNLGFKTN